MAGDNIKRTIWRLEGEAKDIISQLEKVKKQFSDSNTESKKFAQQIKTGSKSVIQQYKDEQGVINKLKFAIDQLKIARDKSNDVKLIEKYNQKIAEQEKRLRSLNGIQSQTVKVTSQASSGFGGLSGIIAGAAGGFAIGSLITSMKQLGHESIIMAASFEKAVSSLSSLTGLVGKDLEFFTKAAQELSVSEINGVKVSASAEELVRSFSLVASSKPELLATKEALVEVTKQAIILSEASGLSLPESVRVLTAAMNQFGAGAERTTEFIDALAAGAKFGAAEIPEIGDAIVKFGVGAKQANVTIQESVALIELFGEKGLQGAESGTKLNAILTKLSGARGLDKAALDSLKQYGVNLDIVTDKNRSLEERLREVSKIRKDDVAVLRVFGLENVNASKTLLNNIERYKDLSIQIQETGVALEQATINTNNADAQFKQLNNQIKEIKQTFGAALLPSILDVTKGLGALLKGDFSFEGINKIGKAFDRLTVTLQTIPSPVNVIIRVFKEYKTAIDQFRNGQIFDGIISGLRGVANTITLGLFGAVRDRFFPAKKSVIDGLTDIQKTTFSTAEIFDNKLNKSFKRTKEESLAIAKTFIELSKSLAITRDQFDELTKMTDKYGISANITSTQVLALKNATDLQLKTIFEAQQGTIKASQEDFDKYISLIRGFKTKAEQEAEDVVDPLKGLTDKDKKHFKDLANEFENLHKQLMKIIDDRELFWLNQNKGIEGIKLMNRFLRDQLTLQLGLQKAELERKGLLATDPAKDNALQKRARELFEQIREQSFILFDAEASKKIDDWNKVRLEKEADLQFKMRQLQLISIQGDEESLVIAANERFDKERQQALENAKSTGEDVTLVVKEIEERRQQEIINIRRQAQQQNLDDEFKELDIEERERISKVKTGTLKEEKEKAAIHLQFAQERLELAKNLLDDLLELEKNSGTNVELRKQIEDLQQKIRELNLEMSNGTANSAAKMQQNMQKIAKVLTNIQTITDAIINGIRQVIAEEQRQTDFQIEQQQKRIDAATSLAEKGNAEILQQEKERQEKLLDERKKQVAAQKALDAIQFISSSTVAVANAAAQGGGFLSVATIAAVIGAIAGGIALVSSIANSFKTGVIGFKGKGTATSDSNIVRISHGESVIKTDSTNKSKKALTDINDGKFTDVDYLSYKDWKKKKTITVNYDKFSLSKFSRRIVFPEKTVQMFSMKFDVNGIHDRLDKLTEKVSKINTQVPVMNDKGVFHLSKSGEKKINRMFKRP